MGKVAGSCAVQLDASLVMQDIATGICTPVAQQIEVAVQVQVQIPAEPAR